MSEQMHVEQDEVLKRYWPKTVKVSRRGAPWLDSIVVALCFAGFFIVFFYFEDVPAVVFLLALWAWQLIRKQGFNGVSSADLDLTGHGNTVLSVVVLLSMFCATLVVSFMELTMLYPPFIAIIFVVVLIGQRKRFGWKYLEPAENYPETAATVAHRNYYNAMYKGK